MVGVVALVGLVYAAQRYLTAQRLADAVGVDVAAARIDLGSARVSDCVQRALASTAFAAFDAGDGPRSEALWKEALEQRARAARSYRSASRGVEAALAKDRRAATFAICWATSCSSACCSPIRLTTRMPAMSQRAARRLRCRRHARRMRAGLPGHLIVHAPRDATVVLDGKPLGTGNVQRELPPASYVIEVTAPVSGDDR